MKIEHYTKTYGIRKQLHKGKERFFVVCNGRITSLNYAKPSFALERAKEFVQRAYKPFIRKIRDEETQVTFSYLLD